MRSRRIAAAAILVVLGAVASCASQVPSPSLTSGTSGPDFSSALAPTGSPEHPVGVIAIGHSGMTGYMSDPQSPGTDTLANSWATGTNPLVDSIYERLVTARPETAGHATNEARDGATANLLPSQAKQGLTRVPYPALLIVQILGNDLRCDGKDPQHYREFRSSVRRSVQTVLNASPRAAVLLAGLPGRPNSYAAGIAALPVTPGDLIGAQPCSLFSANRTVNDPAVTRLTGPLAAYQDQLTAACAGFPHCRTDGGAAARIDVTAATYGQDLTHPSVRGHAQMAAAEWPIVATMLRLSVNRPASSADGGS